MSDDNHSNPTDPSEPTNLIDLSAMSDDELWARITWIYEEIELHNLRVLQPVIIQANRKLSNLTGSLRFLQAQFDAASIHLDRAIRAEDKDMEDLQVADLERIGRTTDKFIRRIEEVVALVETELFDLEVRVADQVAELDVLSAEHTRRQLLNQGYRDDDILVWHSPRGVCVITLPKEDNDHRDEADSSAETDFVAGFGPPFEGDPFDERVVSGEDIARIVENISSKSDRLGDTDWRIGRPTSRPWLPGPGFGRPPVVFRDGPLDEHDQAGPPAS